MDGVGIDMRMVTIKDKVNGSKVSDGLTKLGTIVLNVLYVVHQ